MHHQPSRILRACLACLLAALPVAALGLAAGEVQLKEKDHKDLGAALRNLAEAEQKDAKALAKARGSLTDLFAKLGKSARKLNDPAEATQAVLAMTADLGKALYWVDERKSSGIKTGEIAGGTIETDGDGTSKLTYAVWTPKTHRPTGEPFPLVIFVPGMKEGKPYVAKQFLIENWADGSIRDHAILVAIDMPQDTSIWNLHRASEEGGDGGIAVVMRVFARITSQYNVDFDRVTLVGIETGLSVVLRVAGTYPHHFAAVLGQRGDADDAGFENLRNVPTWFAGGGAGCTAWQEKTQAAGFDNCTIQQDGQDVDAWAWVAERRRIANPTHVNLVLGDPVPFAAYWVLTDRQEPSPGTRIDAQVDRAANRLVIDSRGVKRVTVFLNDELLDLDKPVTVVCNGVEREEKIARSLDDFVALSRRRSLCDGGRVYVASRIYDMPPPKD